MDLKGKIVLVTGASRGIGAAIAKGFGKEGAFVIVNFLRNKALAEGVVENIREDGGDGMVYQADVTDEVAVKHMITEVVDSLGALDVVVNNAFGTYTFNPKTRKTAWELEWSHMKEQFEASFGAAFHVSQQTIPHMKRQNKGRIIHIVTNLIDLPLVPYHDYTSAKSGLLGFSRNLAKEMGRLGICSADNQWAPQNGIS